MFVNSTATEKIRGLQKQEGNIPCFKSEKFHCSYSEICCWSGLCLDEFRPHPLVKFIVVE